MVPDLLPDSQSGSKNKPGRRTRRPVRGVIEGVTVRGALPERGRAARQGCWGRRRRGLGPRPRPPYSIAAMAWTPPASPPRRHRRDSSLVLAGGAVLHALVQEQDAGSVPPRCDRMWRDASRSARRAGRPRFDDGPEDAAYLHPCCLCIATALDHRYVVYRNCKDGQGRVRDATTVAPLALIRSGAPDGAPRAGHHFCGREGPARRPRSRRWRRSCEASSRLYYEKDRDARRASR